ncbi:hypothetical protein Tco_0879691 [Tanacetum coccineum]
MKATMAWRCRACDGFGERLLVCSGLSKRMSYVVLKQCLYFGKLILDLGNEVRSSVEQGTTTMKRLVEKLGNAEDKAECKKLKKELEEARGFVFEERPNEAINVPIVDAKNPSSEPRGSPHDA